jgi:dTMP kinase
MSHHPFKPLPHSVEHFPGAFISLEGPDGSGKTSNIDYLAEQIRALGYEVVLTRAPGGSITAEHIRHVVLGMPHEDDPMVPMAEMLLYAASRAQTLESVTKPALRAGKVVISDRHFDSTYAYQGYGRGFLEETIEIERIANKNFEPDLTLFFDIPFELALERLALRNKAFNRLNAEGVEFRRRCFDGYAASLAQNEHRMVKIDASQTPEEVRNQIQRWVRHCFQGWMLNKTAA